MQAPDPQVWRRQAAVAAALHQAAQAADRLRPWRRGGEGGQQQEPAPLHAGRQGHAGNRPDHEAEIAERAQQAWRALDPLRPERRTDQPTGGCERARSAPLLPHERADDQLAEETCGGGIGSVIDHAHGAQMPLPPRIGDPLTAAAQDLPYRAAAHHQDEQHCAAQHVDERVHSGRDAAHCDEEGPCPGRQAPRASAPRVEPGGQESPEHVKGGKRGGRKVEAAFEEEQPAEEAGGDERPGGRRQR